MSQTATPSLSLRQRPWDYAFVVFFIINLVFITYIVDLEQIVIADPSNFTYPLWPPRFFVDIIHNYGRTFDPPQWHRPVWWQATIWLDAIFFGPFYLAAIYAFVKGKAWIRIPSVLWAGMLFTNVFIIMSEEYFGPTPTPKPMEVTLLNLPWALFPVFTVWRMWREGNPFAAK